MHKVNKHIEELEMLQDKALCKMKEINLCEKGGPEDFYYWADIVKDIGEAMEKEAKACYYKKIVTAMHEFEEEKEMLLKMGVCKEDIARMGYDNWRYSSGRYAPTGKGHYVGHKSGFTPNELPIWMDEEREEYFEGAEIYDPTRIGMMSMGYTRTDGGRIRDQNRSQHGENYDKWNEYRRHYTESKDPKDREMMSKNAKEHVKDFMTTTKEMWKEADPDLRREMRDNIMALANDMKV